jgi:hypothetical protein
VDGAWQEGCAGELAPTPERCHDGVDDDCDGAVDEGCPALPACVDGDLGSRVGYAVATGSTYGATNRARGSCGGDLAGERSFWWVAPADGEYTVDTRGSDYDTLLHAGEGCSATELGCNDDIAFGFIASVLTLTVRRGQALRITVDGWEREAGRFVLNILEGRADRCPVGARRACYTGPDGTLAVGRCRGGAEACTELWTRACAGEVLPAPTELCANGHDDDCDGLADEGCPAIPLRVLSGTVTYDRRRPDAGRRGWGPVETAPAAGFALVALRGDTAVDVAVTGEGERAGAFTLRVPAVPAEDDRVVLLALRDDGRGGTALALADPGLSPGTHRQFRPLTPTARLWSWSWALPTTLSGTLHVAEADGSGAVNVFSVLLRARDEARRAYPAREPPALLAWFGYDVGWTCGACFGLQPGTFLGQTFGTQLALPGPRADQQWWADAVLAHEYGHFVMDVYGASPREGGPHLLNTPLSQGLAWSEGYATWFSAVARRDPLYLDRQGGVMFWYDIAVRRPWRGAWTRPNPDAGVLQTLAENEVSAVLWALEPTSGTVVHRAFASERMTVPPFLRGYRNPVGLPAPVLPDLLDAVVCGGTPAATVSAALAPEYGYDPRTARCR